MCASGGYGVPRVCAGIVGHGELTLGSRVAKVLEAMIAAGNGRFRGIRFISASDPDQAQWGATLSRPQGWLLDSTVREGFAQLAPLGLSFDAFMYHPQLGDLVDLARAFPRTPIVLNHVGEHSNNARRAPPWIDPDHNSHEGNKRARYRYDGNRCGSDDKVLVE